jgi:hypothetical protein
MHKLILVTLLISANVITGAFHSRPKLRMERAMYDAETTDTTPATTTSPPSEPIMEGTPNRYTEGILRRHKTEHDSQEDSTSTQTPSVQHQRRRRYKRNLLIPSWQTIDVDLATRKHVLDALEMGAQGDFKVNNTKESHPNIRHKRHISKKDRAETYFDMYRLHLHQRTGYMNRMRGKQHDRVQRQITPTAVTSHTGVLSAPNQAPNRIAESNDSPFDTENVPVAVTEPSTGLYENCAECKH